MLRGGVAIGVLTALALAHPLAHRGQTTCKSTYSEGSRKSLGAVRSLEGSNPSPSAFWLNHRAGWARQEDAPSPRRCSKILVVSPEAFATSRWRRSPTPAPCHNGCSEGT